MVMMIMEMTETKGENREEYVLAPSKEELMHRRGVIKFTSVHFPPGYP